MPRKKLFCAYISRISAFFCKFLYFFMWLGMARASFSATDRLSARHFIMCCRWSHEFFSTPLRRLSAMILCALPMATHTGFLLLGALFNALMRGWGGRGRKFKSCHSDQEEIRKNLLFSFVFSLFLVFSCVQSVNCNLYSCEKSPKFKA